MFARQIGATVKIVDVGVDTDFEDSPSLIKAKVMKGTANLFETAAMTEEQNRQAISVGAQVAADLIEAGHDLLIPGDMGIGNTTPSTAIACAFSGRPPAEVTGRGTGLDDEGLQKKAALLQGALELHQPDPQKPLEVLARLGRPGDRGYYGILSVRRQPQNPGDSGRDHLRCGRTLRGRAVPRG